MIKTDIRLELSYTEEDIIRAICKKLLLKEDEITSVKLLKRSLNIKDKADPHYTASAAFSASQERECGLLKMKKKVFPVQELTLDISRACMRPRPVIIGAGPAGLFAALIFAEGGACPIILERGLDVEGRKRKVEEFYKQRLLDEECNIQFGEGGAGAFSDGKLKYGALDKYKYKVLSELVLAGADESVKYSDTAHLGTDKLGTIIKNLREKITSLGGEFIFSARFADFETESGALSAVIYKKDCKEEKIITDTAVVAQGHSARDVFELLLKKGAVLIPRPFGVGVRVEHPREYINELVYGRDHDPRLGAASYHLVTHLENGRSVYSFCMCPGGTVVAATSAKGRIVTNGMSEYARDGQMSNSALLVSLTPEDLSSDDPLAGLDLQAELERRAFALGGSDYRAPAVRMGDFLKGTKNEGAEGATYPLGTSAVSLEELFPPFITDSLRLGIEEFDKWMPGFKLDDAVITAPETRSTSPIRIDRTEDFEAVGIRGLYPVGEGAGYSGGIVSSAVDGLKCALSILTKKYIK